ncbi:MAG TPA: sigma-70 family RNA polymerase sigma factor [Verrucomicrobiae bacterium]|jgi:RNA polymerase sigma factor (sigma-70 family)
MDLIRQVKTYRLTPALDQRLRLAEGIVCEIEPQLQFFVFKAVPSAAAEDVLQEIMKSITAGLAGFKGDSDKQFWAWCYRIARNKVNDQLRKQTSDRLHPMEPEELWQLVDTAAQDEGLSAASRLDLKDTMKRLTQAKPECAELLWQHFVLGLDYSELAEARQMSYDNARMKLGRCLDAAQDLMA